MATMQLLSHWIGINVSKYSRIEIMLLEAELLMQVCEELKEFFKKQYSDYFYLMRFDSGKQNILLEDNFLRLIFKDILVSEEYNLQGCAMYTDTPEDVIQEIIDGRNTNPSARLLRRSIDLHRTIRRDLYHLIKKRILLNL